MRQNEQERLRKQKVLAQERTEVLEKIAKMHEEDKKVQEDRERRV